MKVVKCKNCKTCKKEKPVAEFPKNGDTFRTDCKDCYNAKRSVRSKEPAFDVDVDTSEIREWVIPWMSPTAPEPIPPVTGTDVEKEARPTSKIINDYRAKENARVIQKEHRALAEENHILKAALDRALEVLAWVPGNTVLQAIELPPDEKSEVVPVATMSDWHSEERVDPEKINGLNEYNPQIFKLRIKRFVRNFLKLVAMNAKEAHVKLCVLNILGDMISGTIHDELKESNFYLPAEAIHELTQVLYEAINEILDGLPEATGNELVELMVACIAGNHGRMTKKIQFSTFNENSLEWLVYKTLAERFKEDKRVRFFIPKSTVAYYKIFNFTVRILHGYEVKSGGGVGGLMIPLNKAISRWDRAIKADLTILGHFHQLLDMGNCIVNGSGIGYNTYSQSHGFSPEPPQQAFFVIHSRKGGSRGMAAPIWLD